MQLIKLPKKTSKLINQIQRSSICGTTVDKKKLHLVGWDKFKTDKDKEVLEPKNSKARVKNSMLS